MATLIALGTALSVLAVSAYGDRRPRALGRLWHPPWKMLMALSLLAVMLMAAHLMTLVTGRPFEGRSGF